METLDDDEERLISLFRLMDSVGRDATLITAAERLWGELLPDSTPLEVRPSLKGLLPDGSVSSTLERILLDRALKTGLDATGDAYETLLGTSCYDDERVPSFSHAADKEAFSFGLWFTCSDAFAAKVIHRWRWEVIRKLTDAAALRHHDAKASCDGNAD